MKKTQNERILSALKAGQVIDPLKSWSEYGVYRLASRIHDLVKQGHPINKSWRKVYNRFGEVVRVRAYWLPQINKFGGK